MSTTSPAQSAHRDVSVVTILPHGQSPRRFAVLSPEPCDTAEIVIGNPPRDLWLHLWTRIESRGFVARLMLVERRQPDGVAPDYQEHLGVGQTAEAALMKAWQSLKLKTVKMPAELIGAARRLDAFTSPPAIE